MNLTEVRYINEIKGNGLFAKQNISAGSILFVEEPIVCTQFSWNAAYGYNACDHCLRPLESAEENARRLANKIDIVLPYPELCIVNKNLTVSCDMCYVEYCSADCKIKAYNQYHAVLCKRSPNITNSPLDLLNETWKSIHYPPESGSVMIIPRIIATIQQSATPEQTKAEFLRFRHRSVSEDQELAHKFLGEKYVDVLNTLYDLYKTALCHEKVEDLMTKEGFISLLALVATNGQGVGASSIGSWATLCTKKEIPDKEKDKLYDFIDKLYDAMDKHAGQFLNVEGVGLYRLQSMCNHSCEPNAEASFRHNCSTMSLVALRDIFTDEEITISYLEECVLARSHHTRQMVLKENYLFICDCTRCLEQADDPDVTSEDDDDNIEEEEMSE